MRVLVIGGGIGGLAAALALHQRGLPVALYTPSAVPDSGKEPEAGDTPDAGVWLPPNAMQVLDRLGVAAAVRRIGTVLEEAVIQRVGGAVLQRVDLAEAAEAFGAPSVAVSRRALRGLLTERLPGHVVQPSLTCAGFSEGDSSVTARFEDGTEVNGEVLVGADGARSGVRRRLFPGASLRTTDQMRYTGTASARLSLGDAEAVRELWDAGSARFGFLPIGGEAFHWFATLPAAEVPLRPRPPEAMKAALEDRFGDFPPPVPLLLRATPPATLGRGELRDLAPLPRWHRGRTVLLGDAAHAATPNLGQGAAQALEDALVLALALDAHGTPEAAFSKYHELRADKAVHAARRARRLGQMAHAGSGWARHLAGTALRLAPGALQHRELHRLFALDV